MTSDFLPDVVVLGMPSSGKTVFLSVLGLKFALPSNGQAFAPLGFRMNPDLNDNNRTANVISGANEKFRRGEWPDATEEGREYPLRWDVFTGNRKIFQLTSMDVAGEAFVKAFGDNRSAGAQKGQVSKKSKRNASTDGLLDEDDTSQEDAISTAGSVAERLKEAVKNAKVVCFFINIALLEDRQDGKDSLKNFHETIKYVSGTLRNNRDLAGKAIIVLTQSHQHFEEIRLHGAAKFLGSIDRSYATEEGLYQQIIDGDIPVVAVSAVNNDKPCACLDIESDGLFTFLLMVAGKVAGSELGVVRGCYREYLDAREKYLQNPHRPILLRLPLARKYRNSGQKFLEACKQYVRSGNLGGLSEESVYDCRRSTLNEKEVKSAGEDGVRREKIDLFWDEEFRKVIVESEVGDKHIDVQAVVGIVRSKVTEFLRVKDSRLHPNDRMIFGFDGSGLGAYSYDSWLHDNIEAYKERYVADVKKLDKICDIMLSKLSEIEPSLSKEAFYVRVEEANRYRKDAAEAIECFKAEWKIEGLSTFGKFQGWRKRLESYDKKISGLVQQHKENQIKLWDNIERLRREREQAIAKQRQEEIARKEKEDAARRRRTFISMLLLFLVIGAAMLFVARYYHDEKNKRTTQEISRAISRLEYANAKSLYDSLVSIKWLAVSNNDHLCSDFKERLALAAKYHEIKKSSEKYNSRLEGLRKWLDGIEASSEEVNNARKECDVALKSYKILPPSTSFNEIVQQHVDIKSRILTAQMCESSLKKSIDKIEKIQKGWEEYLRKQAFTREMQELERELEELNPKVDNLDMASVSNSIENISGHVDKLQELSGSDGADVTKTDEFRRSAGIVLKRLKVKHVEQRKEVFDKMLADIRLAVVSNSVSKVWDKYDAAQEFSSGASEREELVKLHDEVLDFTVKECERTLSEVEKTTNMLRGESSLSGEMLDGTRKSQKLIDKVRDGLLRRIPDTRNDFKRIESLAKNVQAKLPVIVQIDGIRHDDNQPVNIKNAGRATATILNGTSPETQKQCVYFLVLRNELPSGSSRLVRVVDEYGKTSGMSIRLSDLVPGINRFEKSIN